MSREFNTAGPNKPELHYTLPPFMRWNLVEIESLIAGQRYFVLHAPRQTGKTTCLLALAELLNSGGRYHCAYANIEAAQAFRNQVVPGLRSIVESIALGAAVHARDEAAKPLFEELLKRSASESLVRAFLNEWCQRVRKPIVLLLDEVDALIGDTLISLLRQLRAGYTDRPRAFPQSVLLCGVRDVRDYRIHSPGEQTIVTGGSAFNIKAESLRLGDFARAEIEALYAQHTAETGQGFEPAALDLAWELTRGQPWLVNALARQACFKMEAGRDRAKPVTLELLQAAKEELILRRDTHLDQLYARLEEDRVRRVIEPILANAEISVEQIPPDDALYVRDLGLIRRERKGFAIANAIYREVIPRELIWTTQESITQETEWYQRADGTLDLTKLLRAFQQFFREHSEHWVERFQYKEAGPQLLLQAFLQRIINCGGRIEREYGLGRGRTDLMVLWPVPRPQQSAVIEVKVLRKAPAKAESDGLKQTAEYMDRCGAGEGHLVLFDRRPRRSWRERIFRRVRRSGARKITVWGI
ncbi:MAG: ATP-binding protein [Verrucomicrobia bacterium]|nr:ATP-binding protein [Verrucomicrobiota bacterium]